MIVTGGTGMGDTTSEAAVSQRYVARHGVPVQAILLETKGARRASRWPVSPPDGSQGRRDVLLVSDPFHMLRLTILARRHGLEPYASPTPTSPIAASPERAMEVRIERIGESAVAFILERNDR
jgi:hypothetical protein